MYAEKKQAQFDVDRTAVAHRPLSGIMATVLQVYTVYLVLLRNFQCSGIDKLSQFTPTLKFHICGTI